MSSSHLRQGDVDLMLRVLEESHRACTTEPLPWALLEGLLRLIPCDHDVSYQVHDVAARRTLLIQGYDEDGPEEVRTDHEADDPEAEAFWELFHDSMCGYPQRTGDLRSVIQTVDFLPTARDRGRDPMARLLSDVTHSMIISLPAELTTARRVIFMRAVDRPFTERERQIAVLLRPHLQELWVEAEQRRAAVPRLTEREWQILSLTAAGYSYGDIAGQLFVSTSTVRKHMENVRERLGVHSRHAAVAKVMPHAPAMWRVPAQRLGTRR